MDVLVLGDVHTEFKRMIAQVKDSQNRGYKPEAILQLGDFGVFKQTIYSIPEPDIPFYFILGNHESVDAEYLARKLPSNYHLLSPKISEDICGLRTVGVGRSCFLDYFNTPPGTTIRPEDVAAACKHPGVDLVDS